MDVALPTPRSPGPDPFAAPPPGPPPPPLRTNRWAVLGFVSSLVGLFPLGIGAGVVALTQLRHRQEQGHGLAVAGIVISGVVAGLVALVAASALLLGALVVPWFVAEGGAGWTEGRASELAGLEVGECFDYGGDDAGAVVAVDCQGPHDGELYLLAPVAVVPGADAALEDEVAYAADDQCYEAFEGYVGRDYATSEFGYLVYAPDEWSWDEGDRAVACTITAFGSPLVGPAQGSGR